MHEKISWAGGHREFFGGCRCGHSPVGCLGREEGAPSGWPSSSEPAPGRHGASWVGVTSRTWGQEKCCWIKGKTIPQTLPKGKKNTERRVARWEQSSWKWWLQLVELIMIFPMWTPVHPGCFPPLTPIATCLYGDFHSLFPLFFFLGSRKGSQKCKIFSFLKLHTKKKNNLKNDVSSHFATME